MAGLLSLELIQLEVAALLHHSYDIMVSLWICKAAEKEGPRQDATSLLLIFQSVCSGAWGDSRTCSTFWLTGRKERERPLIDRRKQTVPFQGNRLEDLQLPITVMLLLLPFSAPLSVAQTQR